MATEGGQALIRGPEQRDSECYVVGTEGSFSLPFTKLRVPLQNQCMPGSFQGNPVYTFNSAFSGTSDSLSVQ